MNNPSKPGSPRSSSPAGSEDWFTDCDPETSCDERLADYLEHLGGPLIGIVPYRERLAFRQEAHAHIEGMIREFEYQGQSPAEAAENALREFGEPWKVGRAFLQEWNQGTRHQPPGRLARKATWAGFGAFGVASMMTLLTLEDYTSTASPDGLVSALETLAFVSPLLAGGFVGVVASAQARRGIGNALSLLVLHSCVAGALMLPRREGFLFALWQLLFWLPVGWGSASLAAACLRSVRRQRFWHVVR